MGLRLFAPPALLNLYSGDQEADDLAALSAQQYRHSRYVSMSDQRCFELAGSGGRADAQRP